MKTALSFKSIEKLQKSSAKVMFELLEQTFYCYVKVEAFDRFNLKN